MASYVITGASRGIGLELIKQLLELPGAQVGRIFAVTRSAPTAALDELLAQHSDRLVSVLGAIEEWESVQAAAARVEAELGGAGLDVLVNNAGFCPWQPAGVKNVPAEQLAQVFNVNVLGAQRMTAAFIGLLEKGGLKKVINMSSTLGSIAWTTKFGHAPVYSYKVSKAALNMLTSQYAFEYQDAGFTFLAVSPGWLKTDGGGQNADLETDVGVAEVKRIILGAEKSQNGKFLNIHIPGMEDHFQRYDGKEVEW